jgi:disulfide bond formation protein DsbB
MGLKACPLCFYQRTFALGIVAVLGVGLLAGMGRLVALSTLALPLAVGGLGVAGFHVYLELAGKLECPAGIANIGTSPQQSLAGFALLTLLLLRDAARRGRRGGGVPAVVGTAVLGALFAFGCVRSSPPMPAAPGKPYDPNQRIDICRPPYVAS